jgi:hypothetical protein
MFLLKPTGRFAVGCQDLKYAAHADKLAADNVSASQQLLCGVSPTTNLPWSAAVISKPAQLTGLHRYSQLLVN